MRERIERRRTDGSDDLRAPRRTAPRRGVRELRTGPRLTLVRTEAPDLAEQTQLRRRPRLRAAQRIGPRPDRIAAWAVALGVLLLVLAVLSAHG